MRVVLVDLYDFTIVLDGFEPRSSPRKSHQDRLIIDIDSSQVMHNLQGGAGAADMSCVGLLGALGNDGRRIFPVGVDSE